MVLPILWLFISKLPKCTVTWLQRAIWNYLKYKHKQHPRISSVTRISGNTSSNVSPISSEISTSSDEAEIQRKRATLGQKSDDSVSQFVERKFQVKWKQPRCLLLHSRKSIRQCKDKIRNLKGTYKEAKENSKRSGSAPQISVCFDDFDQVLSTRDEISLHNITQAGVQEELLLSDWDKNDPPENNFERQWKI